MSIPVSFNCTEHPKPPSPTSKRDTKRRHASSPQRHAAQEDLANEQNKHQDEIEKTIDYKQSFTFECESMVRWLVAMCARKARHETFSLTFLPPLINGPRFAPLRRKGIT